MVPENVHTPLTKGLKIPEGGKGLKGQNLITPIWNFQRGVCVCVCVGGGGGGGGGGVLGKNPFRGGGMDNLRNYTISKFSTKENLLFL